MSKNILQSIGLFKNDSLKTNCYIPCLLNYLQFLKPEKIEDAIFNISFNYNYTIKVSCCTKPVLGVDIETFESNFERYLGSIGINQCNIRCENENITYLRDKIDEGIPLIAVVDQYFDSNSITYMVDENCFIAF